jgi:hypothetical protein
LNERTVGTVERAFQLAPQARSIDEVRRKLKSEGYSQVEEHLSGGAIRAELKKLIGSGGVGERDLA